jgi:hypothetical protein
MVENYRKIVGKISERFLENIQSAGNSPVGEPGGAI